MLESSIERGMCAAIKARGAMSVKLDCSTHGLPDRLIVLPGGRVVWCELKQDTGRLRPIQKAMIKKLKALGHDVRVVYGREEARALVDELLPERLPEIRDPVSD